MACCERGRRARTPRVRNHMHAAHAAALAQIRDCHRDLLSCFRLAQYRHRALRWLEHRHRTARLAIAEEVESAREIATRSHEAEPRIARLELIARRELGWKRRAMNEQHAGRG